jgi:putative transposase
LSDYLQRQFQNEQQTDYRALPSKVAQQILMQLDRDFRSFFKAHRAFQENPHKFLGKPKIPKYKDPEKGRNA